MMNVLPFMVYIIEPRWTRNGRTVPDLLVRNLSINYENTLVTIYS